MPSATVETLRPCAPKTGPGAPFDAPADSIVQRSLMMSVLVGRAAPDFTAAAVLGDGSITETFKLSDFKGKKYVALFFWPLDFTFVCPSEIIAHNNRIKQFEERGVQLVGVSIDSQFTHYAWRNTPANQGGIGPVGFPLVADVSHSITQAYGIEHPADGV